MNKVIITGITGFVGSHLAEYILKNHPNTMVSGVIRWRSDTSNINNIKDNLRLFECDLSDAHSVEKLFKKEKFDGCFHLAAQSHVPTSWSNPIETMNVNVNGTINLLESINTWNKGCRVQICGSSEEYGLVLENEVPTDEYAELRPLSPYGVSKVAEDFIGYVYYKSYRMHIVRTRAFNHTGPRRPEEFILGKITKQAVEIKHGKREHFLLGNIDTKRDITDVRDMVEAYWLALSKGIPGEVYNIATGRDYSIRDLVNMTATIAEVPNTVKQDFRFFRPSDVPLLQGDASKFKKLTMWIPKISINQTITDMLSHWEQKLVLEVNK